MQGERNLDGGEIEGIRNELIVRSGRANPLMGSRTYILADVFFPTTKHLLELFCVRCATLRSPSVTYLLSLIVITPQANTAYGEVHQMVFDCDTSARDLEESLHREGEETIT